MSKKEFAENQLFELLKAMYKEYGEIIVCTYRNHEDFEAVYVELLSDSGDIHVTIDVTADSLQALARDVLKGLEKKI